MRRSPGINRGFAGGQISRGAMRRGGYDFGATSEHPEGLRADNGGVRQTGSVRSDHAVDPRLQRPTRGSGFSNPERDYGPPDHSAKA